MADNPLNGLWGTLFPTSSGGSMMTDMGNMIQQLVILGITVAIIAGIVYLVYRFVIKPKLDVQEVKDAKKLHRIARA